MKNDQALRDQQIAFLEELNFMEDVIEAVRAGTTYKLWENTPDSGVFVLEEDDGEWRGFYQWADYIVEDGVFKVELMIGGNGESSEIDNVVIPTSAEELLVLQQVDWAMVNKNILDYLHWIVENGADPVGLFLWRRQKVTRHTTFHLIIDNDRRKVWCDQVQIDNGELEAMRLELGELDFILEDGRCRLNDNLPFEEWLPLIGDDSSVSLEEQIEKPDDGSYRSSLIEWAKGQISKMEKHVESGTTYLG